MTTEFENLMLVGRVRDVDGGKRYEIETESGITLVVSAEAASRVEEYTDPESGIPVANIYIRSGAEFPVSLRVRVQEEAEQTVELPLAFTRTGSLPNVADVMEAARVGLRLRDTLSCKKTSANTGDCTVKDDPKISAQLPRL